MSSKSKNRRDWVLPLVLLGLLGGLGFYAWVDPQTAPLPRCPIFMFTGFHCPGCGAQRALHALGHGHFVTAFRQNFLITLGAPPLLYYLLRRGLRKDEWPAIPVQSLTKPFLGFVAIYTVLRNLPVFSYVAPW